MKTAGDLAAYLSRHIPLSRAMGVQVEAYDGVSLTLSAPLSLNHNDKNTGFAGSIGSLASLSGWGLMMLWADNFGPCQAAIARAGIEYRRPVQSDFRAVACLPSQAEIDAFHDIFRVKGRARLPVRIEVLDHEGLAAVQEAVYAVWRLPVSV
ncbi:thioesterase domain-containing protein [Fluviicoccus keumensis]|uniref:Thioesterase domain-containing protein n=1 Tax=Fluviicoccus keumensis TaxID=1435465 RepID=A0A4Q7ZAI1_9GAMM|nr:YiiD C-terminal domain-containing protein [Fluviicoccus keumensis]RZU46905.1 thioesterase domain-containing protein [Fluviicoccus keumensis]